MALKKAYRRWIASVLAVLLVCLQLSMASYACPVSAGSGTAVMARMAGMPDCDRMSQGTASNRSSARRIATATSRRSTAYLRCTSRPRRSWDVDFAWHCGFRRKQPNASGGCLPPTTTRLTAHRRSPLLSGSPPLYDGPAAACAASSSRVASRSSPDLSGKCHGPSFCGWDRRPAPPEHSQLAAPTLWRAPAGDVPHCSRSRMAGRRCGGFPSALERLSQGAGR